MTASSDARIKQQQHINMLHNTIVFLLIAILAAFFGFGFLAGTAALIAKVCFFIFVVMFIYSFATGRKPKV